MKKTIFSRFNVIFFAALLCESLAAASPILNITTPNKNLNVSPGGTLNITYTVQNLSGIMLPNLRYIIPPPAFASVASTCGSFLLSGASCTEVLTFVAPTQSGSLLLGPLAVCAFGGQICSSANAANQVKISTQASKLYLGNFSGSNLNVINATNDMVSTITATNAYGLAITPDGSEAYVSGNGLNKVNVINTASDTVTASVSVTGSYNLVAITPDGSQAYLASASENNVRVINTVNKTVVATIGLGDFAQSLVISPLGSAVYVGLGSSPSVKVISTLNNTVTATIALPVSASPLDMAFLPSGSKLYVADSVNAVDVINAISNTLSAEVVVGNGPMSLAITPDGAKVYVADADSNSVSVMNTASDTVIATVAVGGMVFYSPPGGPIDTIAITPDGSKVYALGYTGDIVNVIDTTNNALITTIPVGTGPIALIITPDGSKVYVANFDSNSVSVISAVSDTVIATLAVASSPYFMAVTP